MCKDWFGYSAQHCQMTVPKIILALFGSLGEISGPEMSDIMIQLTVGNYILSQIEDNFCLECNHYAPTGNMCSYRMILPECFIGLVSTWTDGTDKWPVVIRKCIPYKIKTEMKRNSCTYFHRFVPDGGHSFAIFVDGKKVELMIQGTIGKHLSQIEANFCWIRSTHSAETFVFTAWCSVNAASDWSAPRTPANWQLSLARVSLARCKMEIVKGLSSHMFSHVFAWLRPHFRLFACIKTRPILLMQVTIRNDFWLTIHAHCSKLRWFSLVHNAGWMLHRIGQHSCTGCHWPESLFFGGCLASKCKMEMGRDCRTYWNTGLYVVRTTLWAALLIETNRENVRHYDSTHCRQLYSVTNWRQLLLRMQSLCTNRKHV